VNQLAETEGDMNLKSCPFCKAPLKRNTIEPSPPGRRTAVSM